jgi:hypothetical protein
VVIVWDNLAGKQGSNGLAILVKIRLGVVLEIFGKREKNEMDFHST